MQTDDTKIIMVITDTVTHVAGVIAKIEHRFVQRCCVCGEKLADNKDPSLSTFWSEGELVKMKNGRLHNIGRELTTIRRLPLDFCVSLVEI